jgi:hypothetical protein
MKDGNENEKIFRGLIAAQHSGSYIWLVTKQCQLGRVVI